MLIQKEVKLSVPGVSHTTMFESLVNTEGSKTVREYAQQANRFESLVNTEGSKTLQQI